MGYLLSPKLIEHIRTGDLYAFLGQNAIAWRFGHRVLVAPVRHIFGPLYQTTAEPFFEGVEFYRRPGTKESDHG